jgi:hypothetical protein
MSELEGTPSALKVTVYSPESQMRHPLDLVRAMFRDAWGARGLAWRLFVRDNSALYRQSLLGVIEQSYSLELTAQRWIQCAHQLRSSRKGVTDGVVSIPARFRLRPVHASLASQDIRKLGLARRLRRIAGRLVRSAFRR